MAKSTPEQTFAKIFFASIHGGPETEGVRKNAERKVDEWLKRHGKLRSDIPGILLQAAKDDEAQKPPPPPSDPRDSAPHPFDDPQFTPAGLVEGIFSKYVTMAPHFSVIYALCICFTHVYRQFTIAPRVALISENPDSGKTTALEVARHLVFRPNPETLGTGAAVENFIDGGPGTILLDELDYVDKDARRRLQQIWNMGHKRGAQIALMVGGKRKLISIYAPIIAAGIGGFLAPTQKSRAFVLEMERYTEETKPEREFDDADVGDLDSVYSFLRHWAAAVTLDSKPLMPSGVIRRFADNVRGLLVVADSCGPEWGRRAREAVTFLLEKEKAERPEIILLRHGLVIFDTLGCDQIGTVQFNKELRRLDLPGMQWTRYRGPSGLDYPHPIEIYEQAALLRKVGVPSETCWPPGSRVRGKAFRGYKLNRFEAALREHGSEPAQDVGRTRLRLITPTPD